MESQLHDIIEKKKTTGPPKILKAIIPVEDIEKLVPSELLEQMKSSEREEISTEPKIDLNSTPNASLVIPEYLLPKATPKIPVQTPSKIYSIMNDSLAEPVSSQESLSTEIEPLDMERDSPFKLKLQSKTKLNPTSSSLNLLGPENEEDENQKTKQIQKREDETDAAAKRKSKSRSRERVASKRTRDQRSREHSPKRNRDRNYKRQQSRDLLSPTKPKERSPLRRPADRDIRSF
ncbi:uncharacterized protein LOC129752934 [Uranotaenia lowii]|uniref:uncharacterized protein LOC129752934 n=1 Tax=Uranotaenia lowii TaxID=190385 RepID=UPI00247B2A99|nr:uncharacterized protein LOC129752934 [Uranotaenia lowii]